MKLKISDLERLLHICEQTKSAELTGHDNLVYDVITMEQFKEVVGFAIEAKEALKNYSDSRTLKIPDGYIVNIPHEKSKSVLNKYLGEK